MITMRKEYSSPSMTVERMAIDELLVASVVVHIDGDEKDNVTDVNEILARRKRNDVWEDEEEGEEQQNY